MASIVSWKELKGADTGLAHPPGATVRDGGVNFSLFSKHAEGVDLLLFETPDQPNPSRVIKLDPVFNKTYHYWHVSIAGLRAGQIYGYRVQGPFSPGAGLRFDPGKVLLDPYGKDIVVPAAYSRAKASEKGDNCATAMKSVVVDSSGYDWEGDTHPGHPMEKIVIYEMHVRGFTRHPSSKVSEAKRGKYAGVIEKIPYLLDLGITAVELLPVFQFDAYDAPDGRVNYWGYAPISFFAPHEAYSSRTDPLGPIEEFKDMVKALHAAGIEVILDVVFNHTAEGGAEGPVLSYRGIDNPTYYILEDGGAGYANYSGTGNTLSANNPVVRRMILDSLRYWVDEMHVDGFRFDLASILGRDAAGNVLQTPPVLWDIESDPSLAGIKLIAEAWDAAGLYQVGSFVGDSWRKWNGKFRDDVRCFFRGDNGFVGRFADRMIGSPEIYIHKKREAEQSINFITCHDGFTLNDLVSYRIKNNFENGENNRDGCDDNKSFNCGFEGPSEDPEIEKLRNRQVKNFLCATLVSLGVPMILMGDEARRSQGGNNNAYCQDNEISWFNWSLLEEHSDIFRFAKTLISRRARRSFANDAPHLSLSEFLRRASFWWSGVRLYEPDWTETSHSLALTAEIKPSNMRTHFMFNAHSEPLEFQVPEGVSWGRWIDTALDSPDDIAEWGAFPRFQGSAYRVQAHSVVALASNI